MAGTRDWLLDARRRRQSSQSHNVGGYSCRARPARDSEGRGGQEAIGLFRPIDTSQAGYAGEFGEVIRHQGEPMT